MLVYLDCVALALAMRALLEPHYGGLSVGVISVIREILMSLE
jgi:hypothetical protein